MTRGVRDDKKNKFGMKRLIYIVALALGVVAACQKDGARNGDGVQCVSRMRVEIPYDGQTKAVSGGKLVDVVYYEVWSDDFQTLLFGSSAAVHNGVAEMDIALVKDQVYKMVFWAQCESVESPYSWSDLKRVNVDYSKFTQNNKDCYDAFYSVETITADGKDKTVCLYRPFAQMNFGTTTLTTAFGEFTINSNAVTVSQLATAFNTEKGYAYADSYVSDVTIDADAGGLVQQESSDRRDLEIGKDAYYWVAMNYLLVPAQDKATVKVDVSFDTSGGSLSHSIENVPIQKNYRTNIVGDLFTSSAHLKIVVMPDFEKPDLGNTLNNN